MADSLFDPSPGDSPEDRDRLHQIRAFWELIDVGGSPGETTWGELEKWRAEVMAALATEPKDISKAGWLTAYVAFLMTGQSEL